VDILLINTPFLPLNYSERVDLPLHRQERTSVSPPLGVCYLSAYLKKRGYKVSILDLNVETFYLLKTKGTYTIHDIVYLIKDKGYHDIMGISCLTSARYKQAHQLAEIGKWLGMTTIMGGNYPTNSPEMVLKDKNVDYIVLGEGETIFHKLLQSLEEGVGLEEITGIGYKDKIRLRSYSDYIQDLDTIPFPDYEALEIDKYFKINMSQSWDGNHRSFTLFTSRGCPNHCTYCTSHNTFGYKNRVRSVENVLGEIDWLTNKFGCDEILLQDDNFSTNKKRAFEILDKIKIKWAIPNGLEVNTIDKEFLEKAKQSGATDLTFAVESGSQRVLKMIKKSVDLEHAKQVINWMRELGLYSKVFFMIGFPGETKEDMQKTIDFASELKADWSLFSIVHPLPGSEISLLAKPVYDNMGYANANITTKDFTAQEVEKIVNDANININFINNPNINRNREWAKRDFKRILERYPEHLPARRALENLCYC